MRARGFAPLDSAANFVLLPLGGAGNVACALLERGIAVRAFESLEGIGDALRVTVGFDDDLDELVEALETLVPLAARSQPRLEPAEARA